jgi:hypothetical protein
MINPPSPKWGSRKSCPNCVLGAATILFRIVLIFCLLESDIGKLQVMFDFYTVTLNVPRMAPDRHSEYGSFLP